METLKGVGLMEGSQLLLICRSSEIWCSSVCFKVVDHIKSHVENALACQDNIKLESIKGPNTSC